MKTLVLTFVLWILNDGVSGFADWSSDMSADKWNKQAKATLDAVLNIKQNKNIAKNVILFLGDGMGATTITAGRIYKGQMKGKNGEEEITNIEKLPHVGLSKTYNIDTQTPDSAGTATAFLCGVKTRIGLLGLDGKTIYGDCKSSKNSKIDSIAKWAHDAGKSVGIVTTTRVTHATPAGVYAHSADREWETYDGKVYTKQIFDDGCKDIAAQLIDDVSYVDLVLGGGRGHFLPNNIRDYAQKSNGTRIDNRHLINEWMQKLQKQNKTGKFVWNTTDFRAFDVNKYDSVLGLLAYSHMLYEIDRKEEDEPSLVEMTEKAIKFLSKNKNGYFLLVEGGKIDQAHHDSKAKKALRDFIELDNAIGAAVKLTSSDDTLILATADHSHVFNIGGYPFRGNNIFGIAYNQWQNYSDVNLTYTSLTYGNGPGGIQELRKKNLTDDEVDNKEYVQEAPVYLFYETHGGEDVPMYADGPMSFLFEGTVEQNYIAHAMAYSACIGQYNTVACRRERSNDSISSKPSSFAIYILLSLFFYASLNFM